MINLKTDRETYISGSYGSKFFNIKYDEAKFESMLDLSLEMDRVLAAETIQPSDVQALLGQIEELITVTPKTILSNIRNLVYLDHKECFAITAIAPDGEYQEELTSEATKYIMDLNGSGVNVQPVVYCFMRLMTAKHYTPRRLNKLVQRLKATFTDTKHAEKLIKEFGLSEDVALERSVFPDVQITVQGLLSLYKVVKEVTEVYAYDEDNNPIKVPAYPTKCTRDAITGKETVTVTYPDNIEDRVFRPAIYSDGIDFYCGDELGYKYVVGEVHKIPKWSDMDMNEHVSHSGTGIYCGSLSYVKAYHRKGREVLRGFVCPSNIGKFTDEGRGEITCKEILLFDSLTLNDGDINTSLIKGAIHSSEYANTTMESVEKAFCDRLRLIADTAKLNKD